MKTVLKENQGEEMKSRCKWIQEMKWVYNSRHSRNRNKCLLIQPSEMFGNELGEFYLAACSVANV